MFGVGLHFSFNDMWKVRAIANPKSATVFRAGDRLGVIGSPEQIEAVKQVLAD